MNLHSGSSEYILFEFWKTQDVGSFLAAALFAYCLAVAYDVIKYYRNHNPGSAASVTVTKKRGDATTSVHVENSEGFIDSDMLSWRHAAKTMLYILETFTFYCAMLLAMTGNIWLFSAVIAGAATGYFSFDFRRHVHYSQARLELKTITPPTTKQDTSKFSMANELPGRQLGR